MFNSPSHSPSSTGFSAFGCALGIAAVAYGVRVIIRREIRARVGQGPYLTHQGKEAVYMGLGIILIGLLFSISGILGLIELYHLR